MKSSMRKKVVVITIIFICALLTACTSTANTPSLTMDTRSTVVWTQTATIEHTAATPTLNPTPTPTLAAAYTPSPILAQSLPQGAVARLGQGEIEDVAFSPDGEHLAIGTSIGMLMYRINRETDTLEKAWFRLPRKMIRDVAFSPDGAFLVKGDGLNILDAVTFQPIAWPDFSAAFIDDPFANHGPTAFSPDGNLLAAANSEGMIMIGDLRNKRLLHSFAIDEDMRFYQLAFSADGNELIASAYTFAESSFYRSVILWDLEQGKQTFVFQEPTSENLTFAISSAGTRLAIGRGREVKLWDIIGRAQSLTLSSPASIKKLAFIGSEKLQAWTEDALVEWDLPNEQPSHILPWPEDRVISSMAFSPTEPFLAMGLTNGAVWLWNWQTEKDVAYFEGHTDLVTALTFSPDGSQLASSGEKVILWDLKGLRQIRTFPDAWFRLAFSIDGKRLAALTYEKATVWDVASGKLLYSVSGEQMSGIAFLPDGRLVYSTYSYDTFMREILLVDIDDPSQIQKIETDFLIGNLALSPDGSQLAALGGEAWDPTTGNPLYSVAQAGWLYLIGGIAFSPDGKFLATGTRWTLALQETSEGSVLSEFHTDQFCIVDDVAFAHDSSRLASLADDGTVLLWDMQGQIP